MFAEQLFSEIEAKKKSGGISFEVKFSMLEIYNEVFSRGVLGPTILHACCSTLVADPHRSICCLLQNPLLCQPRTLH